MLGADLVEDALMNPYWHAPAVAVAVPLVLGPLGAWLRVLHPDVGFFLFGMALFLAVAASVGLAAAAAYATVTARAWRSSALRAALLPVAVALASIAYVQTHDAPPLHDVSTDLVDRPVFRSEALPSEATEERAARLEQSARMQREAYPDLVPLSLPGSPAQVFARALEAAGRMPGWKIAHSDPGRGEIEATATSRIFGFVDDVAIRVRSAPDGARIDLRSRSRPGRADFGANAARIRAFIRAIQQ
jgi:uncharacterized protein (DUF1499 family)